MTIYLIRHGKTEANEKHLYCGSTDLPLSDTGRRELVSRTVPENCRFFSSGLRRANETLELLFGNVPYETVPGLREMDFGIFEMHSYEALKATPAYIAWITGDNEANSAPGGESGNQMRARVLDAFRRIAADGRDAVIVTHGGVIAAVMGFLFPEEHKNRYQWQCSCGSGYRLSFTNGTWTYAPDGANVPEK